MNFSSVLFVFCFLPIILLLYYFIPGRRGKDIVLLCASLIFYAAGQPVYLILMLFSMLFNYFMAMDLNANPDQAKKTASLVFTIVVNLFILGFFKYYGFLLDSLGSLFRTTISHPELSLPIGLSFYTFRNMSYVIDVYKGRTEPAPGLMTFAVYSTMFPYMTAGPIVRYSDIKEQLEHRIVNLSGIGMGLEMFIKGLAKKVILADNLALLFAEVNVSAERTVLFTWLGLIAYTLEIYLDFSGYSDMAIGLGKMFGFDFGKNFDYPYTSRSVTEFWRRWHITLGSWFRDYVYIPLGGNRVTLSLHVRNIIIVWALTGLWHGASWNFVLWGIYYGLLLLFEKYVIDRMHYGLPGWFRCILTIFAVMIGWAFFSQSGFGDSFRFIGNLFGIGASGAADVTALYFLKENLILILLGCITSTPYPQMLHQKLRTRSPHAAAAAVIILLVISVACMVAGSYKPFMYQQF